MVVSSNGCWKILSEMVSFGLVEREGENFVIPTPYSTIHRHVQISIIESQWDTHTCTQGPHKIYYAMMGWACSSNYASGIGYGDNSIV